jgi:hypothetical protein
MKLLDKYKVEELHKLCKLTTSWMWSQDLEDDDIEGEYYGFFEDLEDLFRVLKKRNIPNIIKVINKYIMCESWENYSDDDGTPWTLGGMFFARLEWVIEGTEHSIVKNAAAQLIDPAEKILTVVDDLIELSKQSK